MTIFFISNMARIAASAAFAIGARHQFEKPPWRNLPGEPIAILQPTAGRFGTAIGELAPECVDLFLRLAFDQERNGFVEWIVLPAVQGVEPLSRKLEGDEHDRAFLARIGGGVAGDVDHAAVVEQRGVEPRRFLGLVVEP